LNAENLVLRGMSLRNTECITGVVVYTGHETKILMNSAEARYKKSRLDVFTDNAVKWLFFIQLAATFVLGCIAFFPISAQWDKAYYLYNFDERDADDKPSFATIIRIMGTWILLFVNLVPISLMISMDIVRILQGSFMQKDILMFDEGEALAMRCAASNLNEELG
jgi:magnesium-transporting ATPase (P-type)